MLKKGKFPWYSNELSLAPPASSLFNDLNNKKKWPYIKTSILELQQLLSEMDLDIEKVVKALKKEPIIAGEMLALTNKVKEMRGDTTKIEDVKHAILYVGIQKLKDIVLFASSMDIELKTKYFSVAEFWEQSHKTALVTEYLSKKFAPHLSSENMYFAGFLMKIGKLVSAFYYPEEIDLIVQEIKNPKNKISWQSLEKHFNIKSYVVLGELACALWGFPDYILDCCKYHAVVPKSKQKKMSRNDIAAFANQMTNWLLYLSVDIDYEILDRMAERLGISKQGMSDLAYEIGDYVNNAE